MELLDHGNSARGVNQCGHLISYDNNRHALGASLVITLNKI